VTDGLVINDRLVIPEAELSWRFSRSSGPGGQGVNTSDSKAELSYDVLRSPTLPDYLRARAVQRLGARLVDGVVTISASEHRSQLRNRDAALARLCLLLRDAIAPPAAARRPTKPSAGARARRIEAKKHRGSIKKHRQRPADD
jgi:ribosome-associated protein